MVGFIIEIILGLVVIRIALYIFNLIDGAGSSKDMFLIDTCIITGTLLLVISALPIVLGLYGVIQYFIH
jgi:hypothetical protein